MRSNAIRSTLQAETRGATVSVPRRSRTPLSPRRWRPSIGALAKYKQLPLSLTCLEIHLRDLAMIGPIREGTLAAEQKPGRAGVGDEKKKVGEGAAEGSAQTGPSSQQLLTEKIARETWVGSLDVKRGSP